jgi:hypothetical protein
MTVTITLVPIDVPYTWSLTQQPDACSRDASLQQRHKEDRRLVAG